MHMHRHTHMHTKSNNQKMETSAWHIVDRVYVCAHRHGGARGNQERGLDPLELEFQVPENHLIWVPGTEPEARAASVLSH